MPKYEIEYTVERWYRITVEAENEEKAREKFYDGDYEDDARDVGNELQDSVLIEEMEEANA